MTVKPGQRRDRYLVPSKTHFAWKELIDFIAN